MEPRDRDRGIAPVGLDCGLVLKAVSLVRMDPPASAAQAFTLVSQATNERDTRIKAAQTKRIELLTRAGGRNGAKLGNAIADWWQSRDKKDRAGVAKANQTIETLLRDETNRGGEIKKQLAEADAYRKEITDRAEGEERRLKELLDRPENLHGYLEFFRIAAVQEVLQSCMESYLWQPTAGSGNELELILGRRPNVMKQKSLYKKTR